MDKPILKTLNYYDYNECCKYIIENHNFTFNQIRLFNNGFLRRKYNLKDDIFFTMLLGDNDRPNGEMMNDIFDLFKKEFSDETEKATFFIKF
jgi:hypothetical protein